jgi:hypothetical protein
MVITLSGCSEEESLEEKYTSYDFPDSVDNEEISQEMFWQVGGFLTKLDETHLTGLDMKNRLIENAQTGKIDEVLIKDYKEFLYEDDILLEGFFFDPVTSVDKELAHHMENYISLSKIHNDYMNDYLSDNNFDNFSLALDKAAEANISLEVLLQAVEIYELYPE